MGSAALLDTLRRRLRSAKYGCMRRPAVAAADTSMHRAQHTAHVRAQFGAMPAQTALVATGPGIAPCLRKQRPAS